MNDNIVINPLSTRDQFLENGDISLVPVQQLNGGNYVSRKEDGTYANRIFKTYSGRVRDDGTLDFTDTNVGLSSTQTGLGEYEINVPVNTIKTVQVSVENIPDVTILYIIDDPNNIIILIHDDIGAPIDSFFSFIIRCI